MNQIVCPMMLAFPWSRAAAVAQSSGIGLMNLFPSVDDSSPVFLGGVPRITVIFSGSGL
jgi:hypothetical protein